MSKGDGVCLIYQSVNTKRDTYSHESLDGYTHEIYNMNNLYDSFLRARSGSAWKPSVQQFEQNFLSNLATMSQELEDMTYEFKPNSNFIITERGKKRVIRGERIEDRIVKHSLCDTILNPAMYPYLIFDNGASQIGKGISFTRRRLEEHIHSYYREYGTNEGYVLLLDFSKYYDNIRHDILYELFNRYVDDERALWLIRKSLERSKVDVSYMTDEEYAICMESLFDSIEYAKILNSQRTGEKYMRKHLHLGDQISQTAGISYRTPIDNYIKIVKGVKRYDVYMDDSVVIHDNREFLVKLVDEVDAIAKRIGVILNRAKTRIVKLSRYWRFLQINYRLTHTGRLIHKIHPKRLTTMRRAMRRRAEHMQLKEFEDWYRAWFNSYYRYMSMQQRTNLDALFIQLKEVIT